MDEYTRMCDEVERLQAELKAAQQQRDSAIDDLNTISNHATTVFGELFPDLLPEVTPIITVLDRVAYRVRVLKAVNKLHVTERRQLEADAVALRRSMHRWTDPLLHSHVEDGLPDGHPLAFQQVSCKSCGSLVHAANNECMTTWVETGKGAYCLTCFLGQASYPGVVDDAWVLDDVYVVYGDSIIANQTGEQLLNRLQELERLQQGFLTASTVATHVFKGNHELERCFVQIAVALGMSSPTSQWATRIADQAIARIKNNRKQFQRIWEITRQPLPPMSQTSTIDLIRILEGQLTNIAELAGHEPDDTGEPNRHPLSPATKRLLLEDYGLSEADLELYNSEVRDETS